jgi:hypothetical protein
VCIHRAIVVRGTSRRRSRGCRCRAQFRPTRTTLTRCGQCTCGQCQEQDLDCRSRHGMLSKSYGEAKECQRERQSAGSRCTTKRRQHFCNDTVASASGLSDAEFLSSDGFVILGLALHMARVFPGARSKRSCKIVMRQNWC